MEEKYCNALVFLCSTDKKFLLPFEPIILIEKIFFWIMDKNSYSTNHYFIWEVL
jgi:hypothetical protein